MDIKAIVIVSILVVGIVVGTVLFVTNKQPIANASNPYQINYNVVGTINIYNVSKLTPLLSTFVNSSYTQFASSIVQYGTLNFIKINNTKGVIGYFKAGPLSSFAFTQLNATLTSHGFKYAEYQSLLYDYNVTTAVGFDGKYFYVVHQNSSNLNLTIRLLYYLYTSPKTFNTTTSSNEIASGSFKFVNFTAYSNNSTVIIKGIVNGNAENVTKFLRYFTFETTNISLSGNVVFENSTVLVYSLNITYHQAKYYTMTGIKENTNDTTNFAVLISTQPIEISAVLDQL